MPRRRVRAPGPRSSAPAPPRRPSATPDQPCVERFTMPYSRGSPMMRRLRSGSYQISLMKRSCGSTPNWITTSISRYSRLLMSLARQFPAARVLLHQQHQLLEGQFGAGGMNAGDRAGVAGIDVAQVVERLLGAQLREQDPVRLHAQAGLQQLLRRDAREALIVLGIKQAHVIRVPVEHQLLRIFDGDQSLLASEFPESAPWSRWSCRTLWGRTPGCSCGCARRGA